VTQSPAEDRELEQQALPSKMPPDRVSILLATRNGAAFLDEQLRSLNRQTVPHIDIWASDDGSTDGTVAALTAWRDRWRKGSFTICEGPRNGFAENFRALVSNATIEGDCFAFCDQDDLWESNKVEKALSWMRTQDASRPLLFCSRTLTVTEAGTPVGMSPLFRQPPSFRNALVQSLAGGNTMVFNRAARDILALAAGRAAFVSHDWWAYQLVTGADGVVHYSSEPLVRYRQHGENLVGANTSLQARLARTKLLLGGQYSRWNAVNLDALERNRDLLTPDALDAMDLFSRARNERLLPAMATLHRSGVYRQTLRGTFALWAAIALGLM
jgi:glycosyltransferase involved in cell wall biosynthesis